MAEVLILNRLSFDKYTNIPLNAAGISWVQKGPGAKTKLALISSRDVNINIPTGAECISFWTSERGSGYRPKLIVYYTISE